MGAAFFSLFLSIWQFVPSFGTEVAIHWTIENPPVIESPAAIAEIQSYEQNHHGEFRMFESRTWAILEDVPNASFPIDEDCGRPVDCEVNPAIGAALLLIKSPLAPFRRLLPRYLDSIRIGCENDPVCVDYMAVILIVTSSSRGAIYYGLDKLGGFFGLSDSMVPANIDSELWQGLVEPNVDLADPAENIRAASVLVYRIMKRVPDPTIEKIASLYNFIGNERVTFYGLLAKRVYDDLESYVSISERK